MDTTKQSLEWVCRATRPVTDELTDLELNALFMCLQVGYSITDKSWSEKIKPLLTEGSGMHMLTQEAIAVIWRERLGSKP